MGTKALFYGLPAFPGPVNRPWLIVSKSCCSNGDVVPTCSMALTYGMDFALILAFSIEDRRENIRRIGEMSKLFIDAGVIALTAFISPFRRDRQMVRSLVGEGDFIEVYCDASVEVCENRDVKGLYKRARLGEIPDFTGISSPYEEPENPEITLHSGVDSLDTCAQIVLRYLEDKHKI